jgi:hypothetical protein
MSVIILAQPHYCHCAQLSKVLGCGRADGPSIGPRYHEAIVALSSSEAFRLAFALLQEYFQARGIASSSTAVNLYVSECDVFCLVFAQYRDGFNPPC